MVKKILGIVLIFSASASFASGSSIGYESVESALNALKEKTGTKVSEQGGWTIIEDQEDSNMVLWSFTPKDHEAYPAAIKRKVVERDKKIYIQMSALCQAAKGPCDKLMAEFEELNKNIMGGK